MTVLTSCAEGGTNGTTVTTGNSGGASGNPFDVVQLTAASTLTFSNTHPAHGGLAYAATTGATVGYPNTDTSMVWSTSMGSVTQVGGRMYLYFGAVGPSFIGFFVARGTATYSSIGMSIAVNSTGKIIVFDSALTNTVATSTNSLPAPGACRLDFTVAFSATVGRCVIRYFAVPDSTTVTETIDTGATRNFGASASYFSYGCCLDSSGNQPTFWLDELQLNDKLQFPGPALAPAAPIAMPTPAVQRSTSWFSRRSGLQVPRPALAA